MAVKIPHASTSEATLPADDDVQIAFLRSIALHRPVGPHKHFQMLPVIADTQKALDLRYQRLSTRLEKLSSSAPIATDKKAKPAGSNAGARIRRGVTGHSRKGSRSRSASVASSGPVDEDTDDDDDEEERERQQETEETRLAIAQLGLERRIDPEMVWNELHGLFDLEALDDMEEGAIFDSSSQAGTSTDAGDSSSSESTPKRGKHKRSASSDGGKTRTLPASVLARCVFEHPGSPDFHADGNRKPRSSQNAQNWVYGDDIRGTGDGMAKRDFYLWPWEDFEPLIAERRLAKNAEEEKASAAGRRGSIVQDASGSEKKGKRSTSPSVSSDVKVEEEKRDDSDAEKQADDEEDLSEPDSDADVSKDSTPKRRSGRRGARTADPKKKSKRGAARDTAEAQSDNDEAAKTGEDEEEAEEEEKSGGEEDDRIPASSPAEAAVKLPDRPDRRQPPARARPATSPPPALHDAAVEVATTTTKKHRQTRAAAKISQKSAKTTRLRGARRRALHVVDRAKLLERRHPRNEAHRRATRRTRRHVRRCVAGAAGERPSRTRQG